MCITCSLTENWDDLVSVPDPKQPQRRYTHWMRSGDETRDDLDNMDLTLDNFNCVC